MSHIICSLCVRRTSSFVVQSVVNTLFSLSVNPRHLKMKALGSLFALHLLSVADILHGVTTLLRLQKLAGRQGLRISDW